MTTHIETIEQDFSKMHISHDAYTSLLKRAEEYDDEDWERAGRFERHAINLAVDLRDAFDEITELKERIAELTQDSPGDCDEHAYCGHRPCPWCRLVALRLAVQPFVEVAQTIAESRVQADNYYITDGADSPWNYASLEAGDWQALVENV